MLKSRHHRLVMTEISRKVDHDNMAVVFSKLHSKVKTVIGRAIVYKNNFVIFVNKLVGGCTGSLMKLDDVRSEERRVGKECRL